MKNIKQIIEYIEEETKAIGFDQISDSQVGALLATLVAAKENATILELGTGTGLSTAWIMHGMTKNTTLITVDNQSQLVEIAKKYLDEDKRVTFHTDMGEEIIDSIEKQSIDFIFADTWSGKYHYLEEALALLKVGGMYIIDDMLPQDNWPEGHEIKAEALMKYLHEREDLHVCEIHWATGVVICTKIEAKEKETNKWNPETYNKHTSFVSALALPVVDLLAPQAGEKILDVGCGDGTLAIEIEHRRANVVGVDMSAEMVEACKSRGIEAYVGSVTDLPYNNVFDAVFSNATLHWVLDAKCAVENIVKSLKPNGRFVCEFGGYGNMYHVVTAMKEVFDRHLKWGKFESPWYFPTVEEYTKLLESAGFEVEYAELIPRSTPMDDIVNWLDIFANGITQHLSRDDFEVFKYECRDILKNKIYSNEDGWVLDYVRLRLRAIKIG